MRKLRGSSGLLRASGMEEVEDIEEKGDDKYFNLQTTAVLIGGQSALIPVGFAIGFFLGTPNLGLGPGIAFEGSAFVDGFIRTIPLGILAIVLDLVEKSSPALQDVTKATQRSILSLLGGKFKPLLALVISIALGLAAGFGEEILFRGVMQYELSERFGDVFALGTTAVIFGLLHAVTPVYALLAALASLYFGWLYQTAENLAVPITTHALYDVGALFWAHWTVTRLSDDEQTSLAEWVERDTSQQ